MKDYNQDSLVENAKGLQYHWGTEVELEELLEDGEAVTKNKEGKIKIKIK